MCKKETEAKDELVEIFKNMTEKDWKNLIEELENVVNSEKRTSSPKKQKLLNRHQIRQITAILKEYSIASSLLLHFGLTLGL